MTHEIVAALQRAEEALRIVVDADAFPESGTPYNIAKNEALDALPVIRAALALVEGKPIT